MNEEEADNATDPEAPSDDGFLREAESQDELARKVAWEKAQTLATVKAKGRAVQVIGKALEAGGKAQEAGGKIIEQGGKILCSAGKALVRIGLPLIIPYVVGIVPFLMGLVLYTFGWLVFVSGLVPEKTGVAAQKVGQTAVKVGKKMAQTGLELPVNLTPPILNPWELIKQEFQIKLDAKAMVKHGIIFVLSLILAFFVFPLAMASFCKSLSLTNRTELTAWAAFCPKF